MTHWPPTIGICGHSGSGKTTLLEALIPRLAQLGISAAVVKHAGSTLRIDQPGKDSDRLFKAGADVLAHDAEQSFHRRRDAELSPIEAAMRVGRLHDIVIVEGHKKPAVKKLWLLAPGESEPPGDVSDIVGVLPWTEDRLEQCVQWIREWLSEFHASMPLYAAVLIGGESKRMGRAKTMLRDGKGFILERIVNMLRAEAADVVLAGQARLPGALSRLKTLPDAPGVKGPLAGVLSVMRWNPAVRWIVMACDLPLANGRALRWLLSRAGPGKWAVLPHLEHPSRREALFAVYDPPARVLLERGARAGQASIQRILATPKVASPRVPDELRQAWVNVNSPGEWRAARKTARKAIDPPPA